MASGSCRPRTGAGRLIEEQLAGVASGVHPRQHHVDAAVQPHALLIDAGPNRLAHLGRLLRHRRTQRDAIGGRA
jgi:hypothetical protein